MRRGEEPWPELRRVFRLPLGKARVQQDVDEELRFHVDERVEELVAAGVPRAEADAEVRRRFGDMERFEAECRAIDTTTGRRRALSEWLGDLGRDARYAVRGMLARPLVATVIVATLALGIGANTAIFSVVYSVLLRPLPYRHPDRLLSLRERNGPRDSRGMFVTMGNFGAWEQRARGFASFAAYSYGGFTLTGAGDPRPVSAYRVNAGYWKTLFIPPAAGRYFTPDEDRPGAPHVVVLSHAFWRSAFGGDRGIVGRRITLSGTPYTVVGIAPPEYGLTAGAPAIWVPLALTPEQLAEHGDHELTVVGLLRDGVTRDQALADLSKVESDLAAQFPHSNFDGGIIATPLREAIVGPVRPLILILFGAVGLVLLIACANVMSLLIARAAARSKEIAIRHALGAGRARIVSHLLAESMVLSLSGGAAGLVVASAGVRFLVTANPLGVPRLGDATLNRPVLAFAAAIVVACGIIFGLVPALRATSPGSAAVLREGGRDSGGAVRARARTWLVAGEVSLALVLLVGAGLLVRSAILLQHVLPGFDTENLLVTGTSLPTARYASDGAVTSTFARIQDAVAAVPGVRSAALVSRIPIGNSGWDCTARPEGSTSSDDHAVDANMRSATGTYFGTIGVPVLAGRAFTSADAADAPPVVVINRALAHRLFGDAPPVGRRLATCVGGTPAAPVWREVVGVIGDMHASGLDQDVRDEVYFPIAQFVQPGMAIVVRGAVPAATLAPAIRHAVAQVDPLLALYTPRTMEEVIADSLAVPRFTTMLLVALGVTGLLLATVGIYGVIAYLVTQRWREFGVRMALGADARRVLSMVVGEGMKVTAAGVVIGLGVSLFATRWLRSLVYGVDVWDPATILSVTALLVVVAAAASWIPGRRATRVDPTVALRGARGYGG